MKKNSRILIFLTTVLAVMILIGAFMKDSTDNMTLGLDLQGGFEIVYEVSPLNGEGVLPEMSAITNSISKRINVLGVSEPEIAIEGDNRVRIQLAGVSDQQEARNIISTTANLTFRDVNDNLLADATILTEGGASLSYENGIPIVSLKIADKEAFFALTTQVSSMANGNNIIVTWLDFEEGVDSYVAELKNFNNGLEPAYISAASVTSGINGDAIIKGSFSETEARTLSSLINSGSLPVKLTEIYSNVVSAEFGINAFSATAFAGVLGVIAVALFMILVYKLPGLVSAIMLAFYVFVTINVYNLMGGVFTLPGIAALVLGVGMTVDANVITFERIKDELYLGRSLLTASEEGHKLAWRTIFDSQFTTFIAAFILYVFGSGSVKGFATMLLVTIMVTIALNVFFTRFLLTQLIKSKYFDNKPEYFNVKKEQIPNLEKGEEQKYFGRFDKVDFVKRSKAFILMSVAIISIGVVSSLVQLAMGNGALNLGIDFASGTKITVNSDFDLSESELISDFESLGLTNFNIQLSGNRVAYLTTRETIERSKLDEINDVFFAKYGQDLNDSVVSPVIGVELARNAVFLSLLAWVLIMIFITVRFEFDYALSTIVALLHDILIVLAIFAVFRLEVNTELIAVLLAIIGYSVDDSIVIFDRIRENVNSFGRNHISNAQYRVIINDSLRATLMRSLYNTFTTLLPIVFLLSLGSNSIFIFNIAMLTGLVAGAYSSIFIAAQLWYYMRTHAKVKVKKVKVKKNNDPEEYTILGIND